MVMKTKQNSNALLAGINDSKLKNSVAAVYSQPKFVDTYHAMAQLIKEEAWRVHNLNANYLHPQNVVRLKYGGRNGSICGVR